MKALILTMLLCTGVSADATTRYVRAGASGNGSDWANAYGALPSTLNRGDWYYIAAGSYPGRTFSTPTSGSTAITIVKATVSDHGTSAGWNDAYAGQATFSGQWLFTTANWTINGQTGGGAVNGFKGSYGFKITEARDGSAVIRMESGGSNVNISHVDLQGKGSVSNTGGGGSNDGLAVYGASNVTLSNFHMKGIGRCPFFIHPKNLIVEHGWVESFYGSSAVHSEVASIWAFSTGTIGNVTFRYNLFTDIQSTGGLMWDSSSNSSAKMDVYGNVFYKPSGASWGEANGVVGGWTGGGGEKFQNATVYNNTFINVDQEPLSSFPNIYSGNSAYNNLFYNTQAPNFSRFTPHDYNHFISSGATQGEGNGTTASGDPFVNFAAFDFRLKAATPGGKAVSSPMNVDPLGVTRGADGTVDRGAFEYGGSAPIPPDPQPPTDKIGPPTNIRAY